MQIKNIIKSCLLIFISILSLQANAQIANKVNPKVVGGTDSESAYPWMAAIIVYDEDERAYFRICGGVLIHKDWVLTAAHCVEDLEAKNVSVIIGALDFSNLRNESFDDIDAERIILHEDFRNSLSIIDNDIALIELETSSDLSPISLANQSVFDALEEDTLLSLLGWGATEYSDGEPSNFPDVLQTVDLPLRANADCEALYNGIDNDVICVGTPVGGIDACFGDSGGPLIIEQDGEFIHLGIVSYGDGCAIPGNYGVYTKTSSYRSWISKNMKPIEVHPLRAGSGDGGSLNWAFLLFAISIAVLKNRNK